MSRLHSGDLDQIGSHDPPAHPSAEPLFPMIRAALQPIAAFQRTDPPFDPRSEAIPPAEPPLSLLLHPLRWRFACIGSRRASLLPPWPAFRCPARTPRDLPPTIAVPCRSALGGPPDFLSDSGSLALAPPASPDGGARVRLRNSSRPRADDSLGVETARAPAPRRPATSHRWGDA